MLAFLAVVFGLLSMLGYAVANAFSLPLAKKHGSAQSLFLRGMTIMVVLGLASIPTIGNIQGHVGSVFAALLLGIVGYSPLLAFTHGLKISRIGVIAPIAGTSPLITVLISYFVLHTNVHALQWVAIVFVIGLNVAVTVNPRNWRESQILKLASGIPFALMAALGWGIFYFVIVYPTRALGPWLSAFLVEAGVTIAAGVHCYITKQKLTIRYALNRNVIYNGLLISVGTVAFTVGVRSYNVSIVQALSNSTAIVSVMLGVILFKERLRRLEVVAGLGMIIGIIVLSLA